MLKFAILFFNTLALLIYQFLFSDGITVTQKIPSAGKAESEFIVELTIKKGSTGGFAKLQQDLPSGLTAVEDKNNGSSFSFSGQTVKFIWMSLPNDPEFKVTYKVKVAAGVSGDQVIAGRFAYVADNVKQTSEIEPATITIGDGTATASTNNTTTSTDNTDNTTAGTDNTTAGTDNTTAGTDNTTTAGTDNTTTASTDGGSVTCVRKVPETASGEFIVEVNVNKGNLTGFAKLLETVPAGFTASAVESNGASFAFSDQKVRYIWVSLPAQAEFKVSYKLKPDPSLSGDQIIDGVFSYIENDETKKCTLRTSKVTLSGGGTSVDVVKNNTTPTTTNENNKLPTANTIPTPQGVVYQVQIMALHTNRTGSFVANYYNLSSSSIDKKQEDGLNKYQLKSSHTQYQKARDARESVKGGVVRINVRAKQPEAPPFVVAYNRGKHITVQEALMANSDKWYR
jgi:hypothetical protein